MVKHSRLRSFHGLLSQDPQMHRLFDTMERAARSGVTVLVRGETGSGKELVARGLHELSDRAGRPFLAVNCATLTGDLLASELFGHVRGAFTGAVRSRRGLFERANGGTVFLDEVAELPLDIQPRLLRVLQDRQFTPVGGSEPRSVDVRVISATHKALRAEVDAGRFRADLMFRVRVAPLFLPPLRERPDDVEPLLKHFMNELSSPLRTLTSVSPEALTLLRAHPWPGNVRELRNVVACALALGSGDELVVDDLPPEFRGEGPVGAGRGLSVGAQIASAERRRLEDALVEAGGHKGKAAKLLGISRTTLWRRLREAGLSGR